MVDHRGENSPCDPYHGLQGVQNLPLASQNVPVLAVYSPGYGNEDEGGQEGGHLVPVATPEGLYLASQEGVHLGIASWDHLSRFLPYQDAFSALEDLLTYYCPPHADIHTGCAPVH